MRPIFQTHDLNHQRVLILTFIETTHLKATFSIKKQVAPFFQFSELVKTKFNGKFILQYKFDLSSLLMLSFLLLLLFFERSLSYNMNLIYHLHWCYHFDYYFQSSRETSSLS